MEKTENLVAIIVEDELPLLKVVKKKLEGSGFVVKTARTIKDARELIDEEVSVIWLDHYLLGKRNGLDFVVELKSNKFWKEIPVFVVSNTASDDKVRSYLELGVEKFYTKADFSLSEIVEAIKSSLRRA